MCQLKSAIILKDRVFVPEYDSHTDMLEELGIKDTEENAGRLFVRAELTPPDGDAFRPLNEWKFKVDQDILPDWFVEEVDKQRMAEAVRIWAKDHIHIGVNGLEINSGRGHYIKDCTNVEICGTAEVENIYGASKIRAVYDSAKIKNVHDLTEIGHVYGSAEIREVYGSAEIRDVYGSAEIKNVYGSAEIGHVYGSAKIRNVYDSAVIRNVYGSAEIRNVYGSAVIREVCGSAEIRNLKDDAVLISSPYGWKNKTQMSVSGNATFKDYETKTIFQAGDWTFKQVKASL